MRLLGIDEAGYGPLLGPLAIIAVAVEAEQHDAVAGAFKGAAPGIQDSKMVHTPGDIAAIEAAALPAIAWLTGIMPATAGACFALLGEDPLHHADLPWLAEADRFPLPASGVALPRFLLPGVEPAGLRAALVQPAAYNAVLRSGLNKAELELREVGRLLRALHPRAGQGRAMVDRLGGRRYYRAALQELWPDAIVLIETETATISRYAVVGDGHALEVGFYVGGEQVSPLTALASCIAKYARELHMLLLNNYWCQRCPGLRPTAGYPVDAQRWLAGVGAEALAPLRGNLVRAGRPDDADEAGAVS